MKIQLLEPEAFPRAALRRLETIGTVIAGETDDTSHIAAVFTRLGTVLDADFHARYPALRWVVSPTTGLNHIDLEYFGQAGVEVISLRGRTEFLDNIHATAEHTLALVLTLIRNVPAAVQDVREGRWDRYPHKGTELFGKTVLLYGYGRIGRLVAPIFHAFGCKVLAHDIVPGRVPEAMRCDPEEALAGSDILSIHLPLTRDTEGAINEAILSRLPARAIVVNTSRGEIVDQEYLLGALEAGVLAGAALDVLRDEPAPLTSQLRARIAGLGSRIIVTPHIGGFTYESLEAVEKFIVDVFVGTVHAQA